MKSFLFSLTGVAGLEAAFSCGTSSLGIGDDGRVAIGVESAVPRVFFAFFLRPTIGACTGISVIPFAGLPSFFEDSSASFARTCRSFFCWLFVTCLTGADPTLLGGGELARDIEAEVNDALSDIFSLAGVPGGCIDERLARRDCCLPAAMEVGAFTTDGEAGFRRGVSTLGVGSTRIVRGCVWRTMDAPEACDTAVAGVGGRDMAELTEADAIVLFWLDEAATDSRSFLDASLAAAMSNLPGCRFSVGF